MPPRSCTIVVAKIIGCDEFVTGILIDDDIVVDEYGIDWAVDHDTIDISRYIIIGGNIVWISNV